MAKTVLTHDSTGTSFGTASRPGDLFLSSRCGVALATICLLTSPSARADDKLREVTFAKADLGRVAPGWTSAKTGNGEGSVWKVVADDSAPGKSSHAFAQTASGPATLANVCVLDDSSCKDCEASVAVRAVDGKFDQAGGLVWRYLDSDNYYLCRYNPLEEFFRVYHVKDGRRTQLATKENIELPAGKWFNIAIKQTGDRIECSLNGTKHLEVTDKTFAGPGKLGVWCKADAVSHFDQFRFTPSNK